MRRLSFLFIIWMIMLTSCIDHRTDLPTQIESPRAQPSPANLSTLETLPIGDGGLVSGQPCASPCFFGIQIQETPLNQVVSTLAGNGISSCTQGVDSVSCGPSIFIGSHSPTLLTDSIGYSPSIPVYVEAVIEKYGAPDLIQIFPGDSPELLKVSVLLFWDSIKMRIHLPEEAGQKYFIEKSTRIAWITFFDENLYSSLVKSGFTKSWDGYGTYTP